MQIDQLTTTRLQEMMGDCATEREARVMMGILSRECVVDTDDVTGQRWTAYLDEAVQTAARELAAENDAA